MPRQYILLQAMKLIYIAMIILSRLTENFALIQTQYKRIFLEGSEWSEFMSKTMEFKTKGIHYTLGCAIKDLWGLWANS